jgi:hypothetical protein
MKMAARRKFVDAVKVNPHDAEAVKMLVRMDGDAFLASAALECGGLFGREFNSFHMRHERALSSEGWQARLG